MVQLFVWPLVLTIYIGGIFCCLVGEQLSWSHATMSVASILVVTLLMQYIFSLRQADAPEVCSRTIDSFTPVDSTINAPVLDVTAQNSPLSIDTTTQSVTPPADTSLQTSNLPVPPSVNTVPATTSPLQPPLSPTTTAVSTAATSAPTPPTTAQSSTPSDGADPTDLLQLHAANDKYAFLSSNNYGGKDPLYYANSGDLIDRSWKDKYVILDTKHWKPYISPPPICLDRDKPCDACPVTMFTPYLDLSQFGSTTITPPSLSTS